MVAGLGVLGLALAGCGGATAATIEIAEGPGGGEELFQAMAEAQDEQQSYLMEMDIQAGPQTITAEGGVRFDEGSPEMSLTMSIPQLGETEVLLLDEVMYMSAAGLGLPTDSAWLRIDPNSDDPVTQQFAAGLNFESNINLQAYFAEHSDGITVEEGGEDTIDGVDVTEYSVTIDIAAVGELPTMPEGASVDELPFDEITYSLWVDGDALPRRITSDIGGMGAVELRFFDYGEPVDIEAPAEDDVVDLSTVLDGG